MNRKIILLPLSFAAILALAACNPSTNSTTSVTPVESSSTPAVATVTSVTVTAADSATSVYVGKTVQLSAVVAGTGDFSQNVSWKSSDETKATISTTGLVTGVASAAEVTFTATSKTDTTKSGTIKLAVAVKYDKIEEITAAGTYNMAGVVATVTKDGFVLDDGAAAIYVYSALPAAFKKGDYIAVSGTVSPYFAIWEVGNVTSVVAAEGTAPTLAAAVDLTDTIVEDWKTKPGSKTETAAALATTEIKPYTWTGVAQLDGSYTYWNIGTSTVKVEPSNVASGSFSWIAGVEYTVVAYPNGYNSSASYAGMLIVSSTPNYKPLTGIAISGDSVVTAGETIQLSITTTPSGADPSVTWASSDTAAATVNEKGVVSGVAESASVTITATSTVNSALTATKVISVAKAVDPVELPANGLTLSQTTLKASSAASAGWNTVKGSYPTASITTTIDGIGVTGAVNKNICFTGSYDPWKQADTGLAYDLVQIKKATGVAFAFSAPFVSAKTVTIVLYADGQATEGVAYLPTVEIAGTAVSISSPAATSGKYPGEVFKENVTKSSTATTTLYKYTLVYDVSALSKKYLTITAPASGTAYIDNIVLAK
jgi:uncharacterized protein YjdB